MRINQYEISPSLHSLGFDLKVDHEREDQKTGEIVLVQKSLGYDMDLEICLRKIIHEEIKREGDISTPTQFLNEYKRLSDELITKIQALNVKR